MKNKILTLLLKFRLISGGVLLACVNVLSAQDFFSVSSTYKFQGVPYAIQSADINGDGYDDLILGGKSENGVQGILSVYWGRGDGSFGEKTDVLTDKYPVSIEAVDLDQDGRKDLIFANDVSKTISVILAGAGNVFRPKENLKLKEPSKSIAVGDFNNDGIKDIAAVCANSRELILFKGTGKGSFKPIAAKVLEFTPVKIKAGNYSGKGSDQIVIIQEGTAPVILCAPQEISSAKWELKTVQINMQTKPLFAELGDIDGDGFDDASVMTETGSMKIIFGESNGLFLDKEFPVESVSQALSYVMRDFNNDKRIDLAILDPVNNEAIIMLNQLSTAFEKKSKSDMAIAIIYEKDPSKPNTADVGILPDFSHVSMFLYNGEGVLMRKYFEFDADLPEGQFTLEWNGTDENENPVPDGNYIFYYRLGSIVVTRSVSK